MIDTVINGDCLKVLPTIPDESIDAVITDPPYPHIKRDYGYWTEAEWWAMIVEGVVPQVRRVLKPTGSAVFILQPNSRKAGSMRGWLFEFQAWVCREWNMVQDVWWWNPTTLPSAGTRRDIGLMRPSIKSCVWSGNDDCYKDQSAILWSESDHHYGKKAMMRFDREFKPSGHSVNGGRCFEIVRERGGVTPYNLTIVPNNHTTDDIPGLNGHGAGTPLALADWWTRYIVPPGGTVLDPFFGVGTMGIAAIKNRCHFIGIEKEAHYCDTARERIDKAREEYAQMELEL